MTYGARLAEERKRLGLRQAEFADLAGSDSAKQSLYENDRRELRGDYLARLAEADVDILYILTGRRSDGAWLDAGAARLVSAYLCMPAEMRAALETVAVTMRDQLPGAASATVHSRASGYRADDRG